MSDSPLAGEFNGFPALKKESARSTDFSETSTHEFPSMGSWNKEVFVLFFFPNISYLLLIACCANGE